MRTSARLVFFVGATFASCVSDPACADSPGAGFSACGAASDGAGGYDFVLFPGAKVIARLPHRLIAGAFAPGDYSKEYAIDDQLDLVAIDTSNGDVTTIGPLGFKVGILDALAVSPATGALFLLDATDRAAA